MNTQIGGATILTGFFLYPPANINTNWCKQVKRRLFPVTEAFYLVSWVPLIMVPGCLIKF